jgi:hypothetical protein
MSQNNYPKIHNSTWPGLVGKGSDSEPTIPFDTMLEMTAAAEVDGVKFDGVDIFLSLPHFDIESTDDDIKKLADQVGAADLVIGSVVAPVWPPTGGGSAMGSSEERAKFVTQVKKASHIARKLKDLGIRPYGVIRIDSAVDPGTWATDPEKNTRIIAETFRQACDVAADFGD